MARDSGTLFASGGTRGDPTEKLDAMEAIVPPHLRRGVFRPTDQLIELLRRTS
ncbi:integrase [Bradyrhizobium sp. 192]|uniref:integrase n=1 Tax=Bradyrhizobium sp. 192 TaxID=2782660 RepID=UPI001FFFCA92|nr:integrase [Bradyrhizobium sp. 192]UPJ59948.1 integrase [Bradyrhizobium sp. 192]